MVHIFIASRLILTDQLSRGRQATQTTCREKNQLNKVFKLASKLNQ